MSHCRPRSRAFVIVLQLALIAALVLAPAGANAKPPAADFWGLQTAGMLSNPNPEAPEETTAMKELGVHTVRMEIPWNLVQKSDETCGGGPIGGIVWKPLDDRILKAAQDGITVHANLGARRYSIPACAGYQTPGQEYDEWYKPGGFVTQLVERYGVGGDFWQSGEGGVGQEAHAIKVWEVANEENYYLFAPAGVPDPKGYAKYLIDTSGAIKAVNPEATVLLGGLAPDWAGAIAPKKFLEEMFAGKPGVYTLGQLIAAYDGVSYHPYSLTNNHGYGKPGGEIGEFTYGEHAGEVLANVEDLRNFLNTHKNVNKTLWLTEVGWPVGVFGGTAQNQADDLYETLHLLDLKADLNKVKYVGWYLFQDRACPAGGCGWDDLSGLRELNKSIRYSWCAYSHLTGSNACPYVPHNGFITKTTMIEKPVVQNGQPGSVSTSGTVNVTNIAGEPVTNLKVNVNFAKKEGGFYVYKNTAQVTVTNGSYAVDNWNVGVGDWQVKAVFFQQGNFKESESGWHTFTVKPAGCETKTFITPGTPINGQPGFISATGTVQVPNPECGVVNGQYVNVNFAKKEGGFYVYKNTAQVTVTNGSYAVANWTVGAGEWRVRAVFPAQEWLKDSESGDHFFTISPNGWHIDNLGGTFTADPDISSQGVGRLDVFGRGIENGLWIKSFPVSGGWGAWNSMGGALAGGPGAVSWSANRIDLVMRDGANTVSHWYWAGAGWAADNLGGPITADPDISSWGVNRLDVFARDASNNLVHKYWAGAGWSGWENMGGQLAGGPSAVSWGANRIDVVARMSDNTIGHWWWAGAGWTYDNLGGTLTSDPDISSKGAGKLDVFARGAENGLWHRWYTTSYGSWSNWEPMGGYITSGPGAVSWGAGRVDVIARAADNTLTHWWFE